MPQKEEKLEYKINKFITLKHEKNKTVIYVKNEKFLQCKYLLIEIPKNKIKEFDNLLSIDEVSEKLDHSLEYDLESSKIEPKVEFWGHCSNLQAWAENLYDTSLLHSNIAFPLLKKLTDVGDPIAQRVFKEEIADRLANLYTNAAQYLIQENYLEYFNREEIDLLMEILFEQIGKKFKKKYEFNLENSEIEAVLSIINSNLTNSNSFLINHLKPVDKINKETHLGFSYENHRIIALGFNHCGVKILPSSIGNLQNLEELYLTENRLDHLPPSFGNLKHLKKLDISDNHLLDLPIQIGNLINLKELILNHNIVQILPESISKLKNLEFLSIWGNQLKRFTENIHEMDSLRVLGLSFNQLEDFPNPYSKIPNLEILDLSNNKIKALPENMSYWRSLKKLWLNNNPINEIPDSILELKALTDLYIVNTLVVNQTNTKTNSVIKKLKEKGINIWI
ncbi:MAG: leucine-rich repeat domain-containing protein [Candidatus Odinarchaeota archaeon]